MTVNGQPTPTYPTVREMGSAKWSFDQPFYLILFMQTGVKRVGKVDPADYPIHLEVDWVRVLKRAVDN